VGRHDGGSGVSYPDLSRPYDPQLIERALAICRRNDIVAHRGVYVGMLGPAYETRAEYRMLRRIGGDVVGMSTVFETIVAVQCGLRVLALCVVTNECQPDRLPSTQHQQVLDAAGEAEPKLRQIILGVLRHEADRATG
jgi:purine-nucleoside phosphorylase